MTYGKVYFGHVNVWLYTVNCSKHISSFFHCSTQYLCKEIAVMECARSATT